MFYFYETLKNKYIDPLFMYYFITKISTKVKFKEKTLVYGEKI